jgi:hypothetical protein
VVCSGTHLICYDCVNACVKACCENPGFEDGDYGPGWRNPKTGEVWYPLGPPLGGDYDGDPGDHGHGQEPDPITVNPCLDSPNADPNYLPIFGDDMVCYEVHAEHEGDVTASIASSTYEGIAMNAGLTPAINDSFADVIPIQTGWSWIFQDDSLHHFYAQAEANFADVTHFSAGQTMKIALKVLDWGATARITATGGGSLGGCQAIAYFPKSYDLVRSNADPDSDGFTTFEEYRGFMGIGGQGYSRLDPNRPEMLVADYSQYLQGEILDTFQTMCACSVINCYDIPFENIRMIGDNRKFVDFQSRELFDNDSTWVLNPLCDAGFNPPKCLDNPDSEIIIADQGIIQVLRMNPPPGTGEGVLGMTEQLPRDFSAPLDTFFLPGADACNGIGIYEIHIDGMIQDFEVHPSDWTRHPRRVILVGAQKGMQNGETRTTVQRRV